MSFLKDFSEIVEPEIEQDGETIISYDELMRAYQDYETIQAKDDFSSGIGYDVSAARKQYREIREIEDLFSDDRSILFYKMLRDEINTALGYLSLTQKLVINYRFGLNGNQIKTRNEIAKELGMTYGSVVYAERCALDLLSKFQGMQKLKKYVR